MIRNRIPHFHTVVALAVLMILIRLLNFSSFSFFYICHVLHCCCRLGAPRGFVIPNYKLCSWSYTSRPGCLSSIITALPQGSFHLVVGGSCHLGCHFDNGLWGYRWKSLGQTKKGFVTAPAISFETSPRCSSHDQRQHRNCIFLPD